MKCQLSARQTNGGIAVKEKEKKRETVRSKDLVTRERVNFVISTEIMDELRDKSIKDDIPMSRIVDTALIQFLNHPDPMVQVGKLENGINLYHQLEFLLYQSFTSSFTKSFLDLVQTYLGHFTYSSCLLKKPSSESIVGAKVFSFVTDAQQEKLSKLLNETLITENKRDMKILLDSQPIQL